MRVAVFSTKAYDREFLDRANVGPAHELIYLQPRLAPETAALAHGYDAVCVFVNDQVDTAVLEELAAHGVRAVALRCAGFNNVDLGAADRLGVAVVRVPAYSPHAVAEHTLALILALDRKIHRAYSRVREGNFSLDGLLGFNLHGRTLGLVGTGQIGGLVAKIATGFGCRLLGVDPVPDPACERLGLRYVPLETLLAESDIVSLHCPLTPDTRHLIGPGTIAHLRPGMMLVNTSRGGVVDTRAVIAGLKSGRIGALGLDVYEEEAHYFFEDLSERVIDDDVLARLLTFPNVLVTSHQGFFTREAMDAIAETTLDNLSVLERGERPHTLVTRASVAGRRS